MKKTFTLCAVILSICYQTSAQDTKIRFFGQPEIDYQQSKGKDNIYGVTPTGQYLKKDTTFDPQSNFNTRDFVLFITSQLNEKISVLAEANFFNRSGSNFTDSTSFDVQRLMVRYYYKDYLSFRIGRMFTPLGYWNNQYSLGLVLQPTIQRPFPIRSSSDGGGFSIP